MVPPRVSKLPHAPSRPYVLFAKSERGQITVRLRMFGVARVFSREIRQALEDALVRLGITVAPLARAKARIAPLTINIETPEFGPTPDADQRHFRMIFLTPVQMQSGHWSSFTVRTLVSSVVSRVSGALSWCNLSLDLDPAVIETAQDTVVISELDTSPVHWRIFTQRAGCKRTEMGISGALSLHFVPAPLPDLFPALEMLGIGVGTVKGLGRVSFVGG